MTEQTFFRWLQAFVLVMIGFTVAAVDIWQRIRSGKGAFRMPEIKNISVFLNDVIFWFSIVVWVTIGVSWFFAPQTFSPQIPFIDEIVLLTQIVGSILGIAGLIYIISGVFMLGLQFRTSIDYNEKTILVTSGIYRFCRNPMALGLILQGWATALLHQSWISVMTALILHATNRLRVHFEEQRLADLLGDRYRIYCRQVGRFLPGIGNHPGQGRTPD